jgi:meso-butanediol dehydrogenase/(S,S)-butanediol dehydrogenase/diacetyl reductase
MGQKFENKVAIITGSAGGLGKEFARRLLLQGASVCISDVNANLESISRTSVLAKNFSANFNQRVLDKISSEI